MGQVYLAEDLKLKGKRWAIKECSVFAADPDSFLEEAEMLARLQHPQLPQLVDYFSTDTGSCYMVMDYIQGPTLLDLFEQQGRELPLEQVIQIAIQLCDLFHYLHTYQPRPIIYRDLKPSNVMLGDHDMVRLIDFGVARHYSIGQQADTVQIGTVGFAAPEQFMGLQTDARSDLYTLGAMLFYLLTGGYYAYQRQHMGILRAKVPEPFVSMIELLLQESPELRCQSAMEVKQRLRALADSDIAQVAGEPTGRMSRKQPLAAQVPDKLILVGSLFAGAGATFAAVSLARLLDHLQVPHAVVEHPVIEPDLYMLLYGDQQAPSNYSYAAAALASGHSTVDAVPWRKGFTTWMPLQPEGFQDDWQPSDSFKLLHAVKQPIVIMDISTKWQDATVQELLACADEIIVVLDASPGKCNRPSSLAHLKLLESYRQRGKPVRYVANRLEASQLHKMWVDSLPEAPLCTIPEIPAELVMRAVLRGECVQDQQHVLTRLEQAMQPLLQAILPEAVFLRKRPTAMLSLFSRFRR